MLLLLSLQFIVKCVTSVRMSHLLNQTWYLETSFCLISLPTPFSLFFSLSIFLAFASPIPVSLLFYSVYEYLSHWSFCRAHFIVQYCVLMEYHCFVVSVTHWWDIARPLQCCGNVFFSLWNGIIVTLSSWSYGTLSLFFWWLIQMICCQQWKTKCNRVLYFDGDWFGNRTNWHKRTLCQGRSRPQIVWWILHAVITKAFLK